VQFAVATGARALRLLARRNWHSCIRSASSKYTIASHLRLPPAPAAALLQLLSGVAAAPARRPPMCRTPSLILEPLFPFICRPPPLHASFASRLAPIRCSQRRSLGGHRCFVQLRACCRKLWRSSAVKYGDFVRRCWSPSCRGWQVTCRVDIAIIYLILLFLCDSQAS
jgi:hypothetical protein